MLQNVLVLQRLPLGVEANGLSGWVPLRMAFVEHRLDLPDGGIWLNLVQEAELVLGLGVQNLHLVVLHLGSLHPFLSIPDE